MLKRLAPVCLVLFVLIIGGCGGGGDAPLLIPGNYYPLTVGTTWVYDTVIEVETASELFATTGTFTRKLSSFAPVSVGGHVYDAYRFDQTSTVVTIPTLTGSASTVVAPAVKYLFSNAGGLQPVRAYYVVNPLSAGSPTNVSLVAVAENGGPVRAVASQQPMLMTPPYRGTAAQFGAQFVPTPFLPPSSTMSNLTVHDKLLDYGELIGLTGPAHAVIDIYYFEADVKLAGDVGQLGGRGRTFFSDGIGMSSGEAVDSDWSALLQVKGQWARITLRMALKSMS